MTKGELCLVADYGQMTWTEYWEGKRLRENLNVGKFTSKQFMPMIGYGITNRIAVFATVPHISNSSDAYPPEEEENQIMPKILKIFGDAHKRVLIITKSHLVARDTNILCNMAAAVSISLTTMDEKITRIIEPYAPPPLRRFHALKKLATKGVPCHLRLDPIIPGVNDNNIENIITTVAPFVTHVVSSTVKPRGDGMKRLRLALPGIIDQLPFQPRGRTFYLPQHLRYTLMKQVKDACQTEGLTFATCREGFASLHTAPCDGSHLI